jgi:hypothetical protein
MSIHCANRVWEYSAQEGNALLLLLALADYADENGFAFPGQETLAAKTRLGVRQTRRHLAALQAAGELLILDRPGRSNLYVVLAGASHQALAAALDRAASFGARTGVLAARVVLPDARVAIPDTRVVLPDARVVLPDARVAIPDAPMPTAPGKQVLDRRPRGRQEVRAPSGRRATAPDTVMPATPDTAMPALPGVVMSMTPDIAVSGVPNTVMSTTPDIAVSALPVPTPDISAPTPDISAPTPDIAVSYTPDMAMSSDPSLTKDPSEDPSEDPSGEFSWRKILDALSLKMDPATFNLWLRGTRALSLGGGWLTVQAHHANALPWLEHRLSRIIERTLAYYLPGVRLRFVAPGDRSHPLPLAVDHNPTPGDPHPPSLCGTVPQPPAPAPEAFAHLPQAPAPRPAVRRPTPTRHHPSSNLQYPLASRESRIANVPFPGWGAIIVSQKNSVSHPIPRSLRSRQNPPLPLAAPGSYAQGGPEGWRHHPKRGPPGRLRPGAVDPVHQWHLPN